MAIGRSKILKVTICFWALYVYTSVCMWNTDLSRWKRYKKFTPVIWRVAICPKVLQTYPPQVNQKTAFLFNFQRLLSRQHPRARIKKYRDNLTGWQWLPYEEHWFFWVPVEEFEICRQLFYFFHDWGFFYNNGRGFDGFSALDRAVCDINEFNACLKVEAKIKASLVTKVKSQLMQQ